MKEKKIYVKRKKTVNSQGMVGLTPEAIECLMEVVQETGMSIKNVASTIITQAVRGDMIVYLDSDDEIGG